MAQVSSSFHPNFERSLTEVLLMLGLSLVEFWMQVPAVCAVSPAVLWPCIYHFEFILISKFGGDFESELDSLPMKVDILFIHGSSTSEKAFHPTGEGERA